ncbi:MAG TPA: polysaccharide deacetylase family protein [Kiritimatiellia bacterium]|nr:polysaccharide deacetylase family protein [Kiritimatiellia bacterium]
MVPIIKSLLSATGCGTGLFALNRWRTQKALRIFTYHGVQRCDDPVLNYDRLQVDPDLFEKQVAWIASRYRIISGTEFLSAIEAGCQWPERSALITFDDGYANNLEIAAPILKRYGLPAVVFITTGFVEGSEAPWWYALRAGNGMRDMRCGAEVAEMMRKEAELAKKPRSEQARFADPEFRIPNLFPFMQPQQLAELKSFGIEIGLHGHAHLACGVEEQDVVLADLRTCRQKLEGWGIEPLPLFAYPYGSVPEVGRRESEVRCQRSEVGGLFSGLGRLGIRAAFTTRMGLNPPGCDPYFMRRFDVNGGRTVVNLAAISSGFWR